jgi:hypothetical protein
MKHNTLQERFDAKYQETQAGVGFGRLLRIRTDMAGLPSTTNQRKHTASRGNCTAGYVLPP